MVEAYSERSYSARVFNFVMCAMYLFWNLIGMFLLRTFAPEQEQVWRVTSDPAVSGGFGVLVAGWNGMLTVALMLLSRRDHE